MEFTYNSSNVWADPEFIIAESNETVFGFIEYSLDDDKVLFANVSAVDIFGMPLYLTMYNASNNLEPQTNSGLYIPRTYIIQHADKRFKEWKEPFEAEDLINKITNNNNDFGDVSRILSSKIYSSVPSNDKKLLTDDWLDFCIDKQFDVRCDNTNWYNYIYPSIWSCVVKKTTTGIYKLHITFKDSIDWQALTPPEDTPAINTTLYHDNNNESKEYTCIIDNSFNSAFKLFGGNNFPISKVEPQDLTDSSWNNSWPDAPINQCWKAISQNIQINYFPPRDLTKQISASNDTYYKDISNNYYSKYDMSGVDTQTFDLYSRTIHECVGETEVYTYAYDEPMFPSVLGSLENWTTGHHMSLYLGYAKHIDNISDTSLYDEVNSKLNNDDKLQPITSDTYHAPKFTDLQGKNGDFSEYYKYFKKPEPF